jgi:hypothetical protein
MRGIVHTAYCLLPTILLSPHSMPTAYYSLFSSFSPSPLSPSPYSLLPTPYSPYLFSPLSTPYSLLPTPHSPLPTPHSPLPTPHSPLPTPHSPLPTPHSPLPFRWLGPRQAPRLPPQRRHRHRSRQPHRRAIRHRPHRVGGVPRDRIRHGNYPNESRQIQTS